MSKISSSKLLEMKISGDPISWITCYDYSFAVAANKSNVDLILVGDSGGMVALGFSDTVPVTMDEMIVFASSVRRGAPDKFIVGDMPKGSYEGNPLRAIDNAMRFAKEAGCDAIKLEGGLKMKSEVAAIVDSGITVFGHIGLTPQSSSSQGGYRVIGRKESEKERLFNDARSLQDAGAIAILVEALPPSVAADLARNIDIPIFGIGAGNQVDGQLLILHDLLGLYPNFRPKFAKCYIPEIINEFEQTVRAQEDLIQFGRLTRCDGLAELALLAINKFVHEVKSGIFPNDEYSYVESSQ
jgi:3-methyl-2-oxobutanoate hydroxymethyltransferase